MSEEKWPLAAASGSTAGSSAAEAFYPESKPWQCSAVQRQGVTVGDALLLRGVSWWAQWHVINVINLVKNLRSKSYFAQNHECLCKKGRKTRNFDWGSHSEARATMGKHPPKNLGRPSSPNASWKKDWAVSNETMPCRLTPAVFTDTEAGVQTDEENKVTTVPTNNSFSYVKQCIRLHKSSKMGQIRIASWFVMFLSFLSYYPKYHVYRNTPFTWASIPGVSCEAV